MKYLFLAFVLIFFQEISAQESKKYLKYKEKPSWFEGYVILKDSTRIDGLVREYDMNTQKLYSQVSFVNKAGEKKQYYPLYLFEYGYRRNKKYISDSKVFYEEIKCGSKVCLYKTESLTHHYSPGFGGSAPSSFSTENEYFYFKKVGEFEFYWIRRKKFTEIFSEYFSDCQLLKEKILKQELTHKDYEEIMKVYNSCN